MTRAVRGTNHHLKIERWQVRFALGLALLVLIACKEQRSTSAVAANSKADAPKAPSPLVVPEACRVRFWVDLAAETSFPSVRKLATSLFARALPGEPGNRLPWAGTAELCSDASGANFVLALRGNSESSLLKTSSRADAADQAPVADNLPSLVHANEEGVAFVGTDVVLVQAAQAAYRRGEFAFEDERVIASMSFAGQQMEKMPKAAGLSSAAGAAGVEFRIKKAPTLLEVIMAYKTTSAAESALEEGQAALQKARDLAEEHQSHGRKLPPAEEVMLRIVNAMKMTRQELVVRYEAPLAEADIETLISLVPLQQKPASSRF